MPYFAIKYWVGPGVLVCTNEKQSSAWVSMRGVLVKTNTERMRPATDQEWLGVEVAKVLSDEVKAAIRRGQRGCVDATQDPLDPDQENEPPPDADVVAAEENPSEEPPVDPALAQLSPIPEDVEDEESSEEEELEEDESESGEDENLTDDDDAEDPTLDIFTHGYEQAIKDHEVSLNEDKYNESSECFLAAKKFGEKSKSKDRSKDRSKSRIKKFSDRITIKIKTSSRGRDSSRGRRTKRNSSQSNPPK